MKHDCDKCQRPLIPKKAYERLDAVAEGDQLIICLDCLRNSPEATIVRAVRGAYLVRN